jgi:hypothetical protein
MIVIQSDLRGGLRRRNGGKIGEGRVVVVVSHSRGLFGGDWRMMEDIFVLL